MKRLLLLLIVLTQFAYGQFPTPPWGRNIPRGRLAGRHATGSTVTPEDTTKFYLSDTGNDLATGNSDAHAWNTVARLNTAIADGTIGSGDVVYFKKGVIWGGQINITVAGVTVTSYGTGAQPIITGGETLNTLTWRANANNTWACLPSGTIKALYVDGVRMQWARYPNVGQVLAIDNVNVAQTLIRASELNQATNYWQNGTAIVRTTDFTWEARTVTSSGHDTLNMAAYVFPPVVGWGVYVQGLETLRDTTWEFSWSAGDSLRVTFPAGYTPSAHSIVGVTIEHGVVVTANNVTVSGLEFLYHDSSAVSIANGVTKKITGVVVKNNTIRFQYRDAITIPDSSASCHILDNIIRDAGGGVMVSYAISDSIAGNRINYIGMDRFNGYYRNAIGISYTVSSGNTILGNWIDTTGFSGIVAGGSNNLVIYNYVGNTMQILNDGAALNQYQPSASPATTQNNIWRRNIIENVLGNTLGVPAPETQAFGLYPDGFSGQAIIDSCTTINAGTAALFIQKMSYNNTIRGNTFYRTRQSGNGADVIYNIDTLQSQTRGWSFTGNIIVQKSGVTNEAIRQLIYNGNYKRETSNNNTYFQPYATSIYPLGYIDYDETPDVHNSYTLAQLRSLLGTDSSSVLGYRGYPTTAAIDTIFKNPTLHDSVITLTGTFRTLTGAVQSSPFTLKPFESRVLVNDAAGFLPTQIANMKVWFDANDITTLWKDSLRTRQVTSNADSVNGWDDKSGRAKNAGKAATGLIRYLTNQQNGLPGVKFGSTFSLAWTPNDTLEVDSTFLMLAVMVDTVRAIPFGGIAGTGFFHNGSHALSYQSTTNSLYASAVIARQTPWLVAMGVDTDPSGAFSYYDGVLFSRAGEVTGFPMAMRRVGGNDSATAEDATIFEVMLFKPHPTAQQLHELFIYLANKWNVPPR